LHFSVNRHSSKKLGAWTLRGWSVQRAGNGLRRAGGRSDAGLEIRGLPY
jgi:hypothetical protein